MSGQARGRVRLLLALVLLAFALRLYRLDGPALRGDEAFSVLLARNAPRDMLRLFAASTEPHPPFSFFVLHYWSRVAGEAEFSLRFTSVWFGVLVVPLIYALGRLLWDERVGLVAAGLVSFNPFYIWHAQEARMYAMLAALTVASTLLCTIVLRRRGWSWVVAYGMVTALSAYAHYYAFLVIAFHGIYAILYGGGTGLRQRLQPLIRWGTGLAVTAMLYLPWAPTVWQILGAYQGSARSELPLFEPAYRCLLVFGQGQTLPREISLWFLPLWGGLLAAGTVAAWRRSRSGTVVMGLYFLVPWSAIFFDSLRRPAFDERYFMVSTPPYYLLIALSLVTFVDRQRAARVWRVVGGVAVTLIVGVCGFSLWNHYHNPIFARAPDWRSLNSYFVEHERQGDIVILNYPDPAAAYYYAFQSPWLTLPESSPVDREATIDRLEQLVQDHSRVWLTPQPWAFWDSEGLVERWLDERTERVLEARIDTFRLLLYHTPRQFAQEMQPLEARLGDEIELLGYAIRNHQGAAVDRLSAHPGEEIRLTLYWRALSGVDEDYVVFAHLLDETGWLRGQQDNQPRQGTFPTKAWEPGVWVVDGYRIPVSADAPTGVYLVEVGMYRPGDGTRLVVTGADADPEHGRVLLRDRISVR